MPYPIELHRRTPVIAAVEPRGLRVLAVTYHRDDAAQPIEARVQRHAHDAMGRLCAQWDARLWADGGEDGEPNQSARWSLSGRPLLAASVDAGWRMALFDASGQLREGWDGRGTHHERVYDTQQRPLSVHEHPVGQPARCVERWGYGGPSEVSTNGCGQLIRHDDPAGTRDMPAHGLSGGRLVCTQRFLADLSTPDWPVAPADRDSLLETSGQGVALRYATRWQHDATGVPWKQIDAGGHVRRTAVDVLGRAAWVDFQSVDMAISTIVHLELAYDASGHTIAEMDGNGVVTRSLWSSVDGRLQHRRTSRMAHVLQDIDYDCDPVGNLVRIKDHAQPTAWFDGTQVDPVSTYRYDTLYQLIEASGRESIQATPGPALPKLLLPGGGDSNRRRTYTQAYRYDAGGNLRTLTHAASDGTLYTRTMAVAERSNRSLCQPEAGPPPDLVAGFDAHGNQQALEGQPMTWNARDQLHGVTQVVRTRGVNDEETYVYGGGGMRQRKVRMSQASAVTHTHEVRYLPGLEVHRNSATGEAWEVASIPAGRNPVRWLQVVSSGLGTGFHRRRRLSPGDVAWRYTVDDHLGSATLELDDVGDVISHEGYYPYGGTAWWAARSELDARDKTMRYSGKERDATGLYYYGYRYYAPWLCRWINPDPAGDIDGPNLFSMVANSPVTFRDAGGTVGNHTFLDALDLAGGTVSWELELLDQQREMQRKQRSNPYDPAPLDTDRNVDPVYRPGVGAFGAWTSFSAITREIIQQATDNKHEAKGPRKAELNKLTAHAGYFVHATQALHAGFVNLPASLAKKNTFGGVELLGNIQFKATTTDALVNSISDAYDSSGRYYASMKVITSARARELANPLHEDIRFTLRAHIDRVTRLNGAMNARNGVPGVHAEVQAYNHARNAGLLPGEYTIYTQKLDKNIAEPTDFVACYNCTSLIGSTVQVYTERGNGWPTSWHRLQEVHHRATGHLRRP